MLNEGGLIAPGWNARLDELRTLRDDGAAAVARFQSEEAARSGLPVKVGFNRVFGYYVELGHAHASKAPQHWTRRQTLAGAERYVTPELKALEDSILGADEQARALETKLFLELRERAARDGGALRSPARSGVDVPAASPPRPQRGWTRPLVDDGDVIELRDGATPC